jgi:hypothetical protein
MTTADTMITRIELREARERAKQLKIELPRGLTAIRSGVSRSGGEGWFLVEGNGYAQEIWAFNATQAKAQAINALCDAHEQILLTRVGSEHLSEQENGGNLSKALPKQKG